jgi:hypothetical protein
MDANLNIEVETAKHDRLMKVLKMIEKCDMAIAAWEKRLQLPYLNHELTFTTKTEMERLIAFQIKVRQRLTLYYAKQIFYMASNAYNVTCEMRKPQNSSSPIIQS